jgi:DNA-binding transcriptional MerR regulator
MPDVIIPSSIPWGSFVALLLVFGVFPGLILRLLVRLYPKGNPRRVELFGQLYAVPRWERPWFVAEQFETALSEGLPSRVAPLARAIARRIRALRSQKALDPAPTGRLAPGYSGKRAADIVGISYRLLDYLVRTDLIRPSVTDAHGSGGRFRYSYRNLLELKLLKTLLDCGIKLESIREGFTYLRDQLGEGVLTAKLVIAGTSAVLVQGNDELIDVVNRYQGQGVLNLLALDGVKEQVDGAIIELFPAVGGSDATSTSTPRHRRRFHRLRAIRPRGWWRSLAQLLKRASEH